MTTAPSSIHSYTSESSIIKNVLVPMHRGNDTSQHNLNNTRCTFEPDPKLLAANLAAIARRSPAAVREIAKVAPQLLMPEQSGRMRFFSDAYGSITGEVRGEDNRWRLLSSAVDTRAEGRAFAEQVNITDAAAMVVRGFGVGQHIAHLAARMKNLGSIFVYEPDAHLLAALLSRVDLRSLFAYNVILLTSAPDGAAVSHGVQGLEGTIAAGTTCIDHRPSLARLKHYVPTSDCDSTKNVSGETSGKRGDALCQSFSLIFADCVRALRTTIVTSLVQSDVTARNCIQNSLAYAQSPGIVPLKGLCAGTSAIMVSAGPSLRRNITLLCNPNIRSRVVVVAVQTTLRTLLAHGIKPDYVLAIDYHEISRRFYEGLTREQLRGVTLIADPKCNPIIPISFPGTVRFFKDDVSDRVIGEQLLKRNRQHYITPDHGVLTLGATVAHSAYYFARYLGCDPVVMIGQDLGFTDGQYYAPGAAIHNAWATELNEFNTIEMLEWQRIARMRSMLRKATDIRGRPIYTDEQMATYLDQFERDFANDTARGLTIIDATEGGVAKAHTTPMRLADAVELYCTKVVPSQRIAELAEQATLPPITRNDLTSRMQELSRGCYAITNAAAQTLPLLTRMLDADQVTVNMLIERVQKQAQIAAASPAYWLTQFINQAGQLNRYKADRAVELSDESDQVTRQKAQIERDHTNVTWLKDAADHLCSLIADGQQALSTGTPVTREPSALTSQESGVRRSVAVCTTLLSQRDADLAPITCESALRAIADSNCDVSLLVLVPDDEQLTHHWKAQLSTIAQANNVLLHYHAVPAVALRHRAARVRAGRAWSAACWRGGIAGLTAYDEYYNPGLLAPLLEQHAIDAVLLVGPRWTRLNSAVVRNVVERYGERPDAYGLTCTQAPPGAGAAIVTSRVVREAANLTGPYATYGALLAYNPIAPQADPISKPVFPAIEPAIRDAQCETTTTPRLVTLIVDRDVSPRAAAEALRALINNDADTCYDGTAVTLIIDDEEAQDWNILPALANSLREAGATYIHTRTHLRGGRTQAQSLVASKVDVVSIDLHADTPTTYALVTGRGDYSHVREGLALLVDYQHNNQTENAGGLPELWVVPRITRCGAVYNEIESFYNRWLLACGACVIDARRNHNYDIAADLGDTIEAFPLPELARKRIEHEQTLDLRSRKPFTLNIYNDSNTLRSQCA